MRIGIAIDGVLRDFFSQLAYVHGKYIAEISQRQIEAGEDPEALIRELNISDKNAPNYTPFTDYADMEDFFSFEGIDEMNDFLYKKAALEIFGQADITYPSIVNQFNNFLMEMEDEGEHEIILVSREALVSIPSTYFFLSKTVCKVKNIRFYTKFEDKWNDVDVLITANPRVLAAKPDGKIGVKCKTHYNESASTDFEIESLKDFMLDEELRNTILNTEITDYEEITD